MSKQQPTSYEVPDEELVTRLMYASGQAGASASGLCLDVFAGIHIADMHYYKGAVLARLAGKKPPYEPDMQMAVCNEQGVTGKSSEGGPRLQFKGKYVIERVWYIKDDWYLELKGIEGRNTSCPLYRASAFQPVEKKDAIVAAE